MWNCVVECFLLMVLIIGPVCQERRRPLQWTLTLWTEWSLTYEQAMYPKIKQNQQFSVQALRETQTFNLTPSRLLHYSLRVSENKLWTGAFLTGRGSVSPPIIKYKVLDTMKAFSGICHVINNITLPSLNISSCCMWEIYWFCPEANGCIIPARAVMPLFLKLCNLALVHSLKINP